MSGSADWPRTMAAPAGPRMARTPGRRPNRRATPRARRPTTMIRVPDRCRRTPRGGPVPRADGYVMGSLGHDFILPPMPPERCDGHRAQGQRVQEQRDQDPASGPARSCVPAIYTTDPDDYGDENQIPDIGNTFSTAWFRIPGRREDRRQGRLPAHAALELHHLFDGRRAARRDRRRRHRSRRRLVQPVPCRRAARRHAAPLQLRDRQRRSAQPAPAQYGLHPRPGRMPRSACTCATTCPTAASTGPAASALPQVAAALWPDGKVLTEAAACAATDAPLRGKQVPLTVPKKLWMALNSLPWRPADRTPAHAFEVEPHGQVLQPRAPDPGPSFPAGCPAAAWPWRRAASGATSSTRYGYTYLSQAYGKVYVVHGKMPRTPRTWDGDPAPMDQDADMRYWSICTSTAPPVGQHGGLRPRRERARSTLDQQGNFNVVVIARAPDRPANATEKCGVAWMEYGNGDGIPGGSQDFGAVINRHTHVNPEVQEQLVRRDEARQRTRSDGQLPAAT